MMDKRIENEIVEKVKEIKILLKENNLRCKISDYDLMDIGEWLNLNSKVVVSIWDEASPDVESTDYEI